MDKNTFIEKLFDLLKKQFGEEVTITQKKIEKAMGFLMRVLLLRKRWNIFLQSFLLIIVMRIILQEVVWMKL